MHRDVKAANVLLDDDGAAYLTDFGIASTSGDARVDVRALGWLAWELLAGSSRPDASRPPPLARVHNDVPKELDVVLERATAAVDAYSSIAELVLAWRSAVAPNVSVPGGQRLAVDADRREAALRLARSAAAGTNPYKGLRAFSEADAAVFFGRAHVVDELDALIDTERLVTVVGASGSGKSSVLRAGLVPRRRARGDTVVVLVPGDDPAAALTAALNEVATVPLDGVEPAEAIRLVAKDSSVLVIGVDQLEECWTRATAPTRSRFLDAIEAVVDDSQLPVRVVTTVRADMLDRPLQHGRIGRRIATGTYMLAPMAPSELNRRRRVTGGDRRRLLGRQRRGPARCRGIGAAGSPAAAPVRARGVVRPPRRRADR